MSLQMLKKAMIAYVANSAKAIWSKVAHPLDIVGKKNRNLADYRIYGNSVQDGKPTPETPIEIQSVGELTTKNLFNIQSSKILYKGTSGTCEKTEKGFRAVCTASVNSFRVNLLVPKEVFKEGKTYTISSDTTNVGNVIVGEANSLNDTSSFNKYGVVYGTPRSFTLSTITKPYINLYFYCRTYNIGDVITVENIQIEEGAEVTPYEPYHKYKIPVVARGKNYFDLNKVPFETTSTRPYKNGLKVTKTELSNGCDMIPISLPARKNLSIILDVVDSQISGTAKYVALDFFDSAKNIVTAWHINLSIAHKSYIFYNFFTPSKEIRYVQFYFKKNNSQNAAGDYVTMDNIMFWTEGDGSYEGYIEPKTTDIYLDEPLKEGEVVQKSVDGLPPLPQFKGTTIYEVMTDVPPSGIEVCYYG